METNWLKFKFDIKMVEIDTNRVEIKFGLNKVEIATNYWNLVWCSNGRNKNKKSGN